MSGRLDRGEHGYVTLWVLGLCICLLFLGGLALDLWRVFSDRRALAGMADAAAIAGSSGIDESAFRNEGELILDPGRAEEIAQASLLGQSEAGSLVSAEVSATPERITVVARGEVEFSLLKLLLPGEAPFTIEVVASSYPREGILE